MNLQHRHVVGVTDVRQYVKAAVLALKTEGEARWPDCEPRVKAELEEEVDRVQGNRPETLDMTWADLRLMFIATLRNALNDLDQPVE